MIYSDLIKLLQSAMNAAGSKLTVDGDPGKVTQGELEKYDVTLTVKKIKPIEPPPVGVRPSYYLKSLIIEGVEVHPFYPVPAPYTHPHPMDMSRSMAWERELAGKDKNNALIAHSHEHSGNLGKHSDRNDYIDEVPHCASHQNLIRDLCGCEKSDNALASSNGAPFIAKFKPVAFKQGDTIPEGAVITIEGHVTRANKAFKWTGNGNFEGYGANQGNTIKTSYYPQSRIKSACLEVPKPGTVLAPIGTLPFKAVAPNSRPGESTR